MDIMEYGEDMVKEENMSKIADFFKFRERNTSYKKELIAGITTFMTMAYVLVVQPGAIVGYGDAAFIIDANGVMITKEAIVVTCAIISGLITLLMALYANLPFALATGMGSNFMFGALIQSQQLSFGGAMAMTLISGVIFLLLTIFGIRDLILRRYQKTLKYRLVPQSASLSPIWDSKIQGLQPLRKAEWAWGISLILLLCWPFWDLLSSLF